MANKSHLVSANLTLLNSYKNSRLFNSKFRNAQTRVLSSKLKWDLLRIKIFKLQLRKLLLITFLRRLMEPRLSLKNHLSLVINRKSQRQLLVELLELSMIPKFPLQTLISEVETAIQLRLLLCKNLRKKSRLFN